MSKKYGFLLVLVVLAFALTACGGNDDLVGIGNDANSVLQDVTGGLDAAGTAVQDALENDPALQAVDQALGAAGDALDALPEVDMQDAWDAGASLTGE